MATLERTALSARLRRLRLRHDPPLNQQQAADLVGLSLRQYGRLERGEATASLATVARVADAFSVDPGMLLDGGLPPERDGGSGERAPSAADFARLEAKVDRLLARLETG